MIPVPRLEGVTTDSPYSTTDLSLCSLIRFTASMETRPWCNTSGWTAGLQSHTHLPSPRAVKPHKASHMEQSVLDKLLQMRRMGMWLWRVHTFGQAHAQMTKGAGELGTGGNAVREADGHGTAHHWGAPGAAGPGCQHLSPVLPTQHEG